MGMLMPFEIADRLKIIQVIKYENNIIKMFYMVLHLFFI